MGGDLLGSEIAKLVFSFVCISLLLIGVHLLIVGFLCIVGTWGRAVALLWGDVVTAVSGSATHTTYLRERFPRFLFFSLEVS